MNVMWVCALAREAASDWGLQCMRYEIRDISPPAGALPSLCVGYSWAHVAVIALAGCEV